MTSASGETETEPLDDEDEDSEDEFFDCDGTEEDGANKRVKHSLWNKPVGRLSKHGNLRLLKTGEQLYIPVTQEPVPKTEDQLEEDTDVLLKLGSDAQGSELRARMMSASLLSDMESFKAANPAAILEDFIRWYSPRDWIEDDDDDDSELDEWGQKRGHLSSRMLISDNTWVQMWESAKPVPANRQKRLFDDTREAEKVLHFLDSRTPSTLATLLLPVLTHAALYRLSEECDEVTQAVPEVIVALRHSIKSTERLSREPRVLVHKYEALVQELTVQELLVSQINSLLFKFNPSGSPNDRVNELVARLVTGREVPVEGGAQSFVGKRLVHMFSEAQRAANMITDPLDGDPQPQNLHAQKSIFPQASKREFVMRVSAVRPALYSTPTQQMLRAIFSKNEFRLAGAFSEDITFT